MSNMRVTRLLLPVSGLCLLIAGCGTVATLVDSFDGIAECSFSHNYAGIRADLGAGDLILFDGPLSLVGDTLILPYTLYAQSTYGNIGAGAVFKKEFLTARSRYVKAPRGSALVLEYRTLTIVDVQETDWTRFPDLVVQFDSDRFVHIKDLDAATAIKSGLDIDGPEVADPNGEPKVVLKESGIEMEFSYGKLTNLALRDPAHGKITLWSADRKKKHDLPLSQADLEDLVGEPDSVTPVPECDIGTRMIYHTKGK